MKTTVFLVFLILLFATFAFAAQIYGTLKEGDRSLEAGVGIDITCGNNTSSGQTDAHGSYSIYVNDRGRCTFTVHYRGQHPHTDIYSYADPVKYDFDLVQTAGRYELRRR